MLSFLLSLGLGLGSINLDNLPVQRVEQIAQEVMADIQVEMKTKPSLIVSERPEPTPLAAMSYANGKCVVIININDTAWAQWGRFLTHENKTYWNEIIAASVAHEMGHCLRESRDFAANNALGAQVLRGLQALEKSNSMAGLVYKQELFSDAVAILYAREHGGAHADDVIDTLISARARFGASEPTHNTADILEKIIEQRPERQTNEKFGVAATRLLTSL